MKAEVQRNAVLGNVDLQRRAVELWARKTKHLEIARQLGVSGWQAHMLVERGVARLTEQGAAKRRARDAEALDELERRTWELVDQPGHQVSLSGRIVTDPQTGEPMPDLEKRRRAIETVLRVLERRAKLLGLDARAQGDVSVTLDAAVAAVRLLEEEADRAEAQCVPRPLERRSLPVVWGNGSG